MVKDVNKVGEKEISEVGEGKEIVMEAKVQCIQAENTHGKLNGVNVMPF